MHLEGRRPRDSMKSTWRNDKTQWGLAHKFLIALDAFHQYPDQEVPVHAKTDKIPVLSAWYVAMSEGDLWQSQPNGHHAGQLIATLSLERYGQSYYNMLIWR